MHGDTGIVACICEALERSGLKSDLLAMPSLVVATTPRGPGDHLYRIFGKCDPLYTVSSNDCVLDSNTNLSHKLRMLKCESSLLKVGAKSELLGGAIIGSENQGLAVTGQTHISPR